MRVRKFELRLVGAALVAGWVVAAGLVLIAYRPGGPLDVLVGLTMTLPIAIALAGLAWPPVARGSGAFAGMVWLGIAALLCLVPSIAGVIEQIQALGSQTLLPSLEAAYPWLLALAATSLFSGLGIARHLRGAVSLRRRRFLDGALIAVALTLLASSLFAGAAVANELAVRDTVPASSRFGPTDTDQEPPFCDTALESAREASVSVDLNATADLRPIGSVELLGTRDGGDFRWSGYVATDRTLGQYGSARIGDVAWQRAPGGGWVGVSPARVAGQTVDLQVLATALTTRIGPPPRIAASRSSRAHGLDAAVSRSTGRRSRRRSRRSSGSSATPTCTAGAGNSTTGSSLTARSGRSSAMPAATGRGWGPERSSARSTVHLTATERGRDHTIYPPAR